MLQNIKILFFSGGLVAIVLLFLTKHRPDAVTLQDPPFVTEPPTARAARESNAKKRAYAPASQDVSSPQKTRVLEVPPNPPSSHRMESFGEALQRGDYERATWLIEKKVVSLPPDPEAMIAWMKPSMAEHDFLWQSEILVQAFWSACVSTPTCDQNAFLKRLHETNPNLAETKEICLQSWKHIVPLLQSPKLASLTAVKAARPSLIQCLRTADLSDESVLSQVQYYLWLIQQNGGRDDAQLEFSDISKIVAGLPDFDTLVPTTTAR